MIVFSSFNRIIPPVGFEGEFRITSLVFGVIAPSTALASRFWVSSLTGAATEVPPAIEMIASYEVYAGSAMMHSSPSPNIVIAMRKIPSIAPAVTSTSDDLKSAPLSLRDSEMASRNSGSPPEEV